jgi:hypothetical protein
MRRSLLLVGLVIASASWARPKNIDLKILPQSTAGLVSLLRTSRDQSYRTMAAMALDSQLRERGHELNAPPESEQLLDLVLGQLFRNMVADTEIYTWDKDIFGPRGDVVCKDKVLVFPGRVTAGFERKYTVKVQGRRIDRGFLDQVCTVVVAAAKTEDEWHQWTSQKGWGINPHPVFVSDNAARIGLTLYSPGTPAVPSAKMERPFYVGFGWRPKDDDDWKLLSVEPPIALDYRKQECNIYPPDTRPAEAEKKLRLAIWMEGVRVLNPLHEVFLGTEASQFLMNTSGADSLDSKEKWMLEPYRKSDSALVRAAAELKLSRLGTATSATSLADLIVATKHPAARNELILELLRLVGAKFDAGPVATEDDKAELVKLISPDPKNPALVREVKIVDDLARLRVVNQKIDGWVFRKFPDGWQILGQIR